ncbi:hypothetical protein HK102_009712 [Quaeritorhiza haematococci]|nr:hypothetical protein HK102_009712 [Quaeritorhiza haematococci]
MNKDEALRCLDISKTKFKAGNSEQALKFAKKSVALCETDEGTDWASFDGMKLRTSTTTLAVEKLNFLSGFLNSTSGGSSTSTSTSSGPSSSGLRNRHAPSTSSTSTSTSASSSTTSLNGDAPKSSTTSSSSSYSSAANGHAKENGASSHQQKRSSTSSSTPKPRSSSSSTSDSAPPSPSSPGSERPYTSEQVEGITRIKKCKAKGDLYAILGLEKDCGDSEIKKAYRKLALQYHPDKCGAPGADEAFKAIGHAFAILSDETKRARYDKFGIDTDRPSASSPSSSSSFGARGGDGFEQYFEGEISPEDIFNMFFGEMAGSGIGIRTAHFGPGFRRFQRGHPFHQHRRGGAHAHPPENNDILNDQASARMFQLLQLLPLIVLFLLSFFSSLPSDSTSPSSHSSGGYMDNDGGGYFFGGAGRQVYSLTKTAVFNTERKTSGRGVKYWVNPKGFERVEGVPRKVRQVEEKVEVQYYHILRDACLREQSAQRTAFARARRWIFSVDEEKYRAAQAMRLENCDKLREVYRYTP